METGASPAGRDKSLLQFSACREQIWRAFRKLLLLTVGKCLQILEGTQCKYPFLSAAPHAGAAGGPGAGTGTRVASASAVCSPEGLVLKYPSCDLSRELAWGCLSLCWVCAHQSLHLPRPGAEIPSFPGHRQALAGLGVYRCRQYLIRVLVFVLLAVELPKGLFPVFQVSY